MVFSSCRQHPADRRTVPAVRWCFPDQRSAIYSAYTHEKINLISATTFLWPCVMFYPLKIKFALEFAVLQQKQDVAVGHFFFVYIIITAFLNNKRSHGKNWGYVSIVTFVSWSRLIAIVSRPSNVLKCVPQFIPNGAFYFPGKWIRNCIGNVPLWKKKNTSSEPCASSLRVTRVTVRPEAQT